MVPCCDRRRKRKKYLILVVAVLFIFSVGCAQKEGKEADMEDQQEEEVKKLSPYSKVGGTVWSESWEAESSFYEKIAVQMDALVLVPAVEKMSVAEVKEFTFDKENIQMVVQGIFGSSVSSYDEENLPGDMLEKRLEEAKKQLEYDEQDKEEAAENPGIYSDPEKIIEEVEKGRKEVDRLTELLESGSAGEDFIREPVEEYQSDHYIGDRDGTEYLLDFKDEGLVYGEGDVRRILFTPRRERDVWPEALKEMEMAERHTSSLKPEEGEEFVKAQNEAEDFLKNAGFSDTLCCSSAPLVWKGTLSEGSGQDVKVVQKGYQFTYVTGVDGLTFRTPDLISDGYSWSGDIDNEYSGNTQIVIDVTDAGVIRAEWIYPIMTTSVTSDIKLLPFEDIKNIMRESMGMCVDAFVSPSDKREKEKAKEEVYDIKITRLQLGYFRLKDPSRKGYYSYVPVWQADGICIVNAIDGTIIDSPRWG